MKWKIAVDSGCELRKLNGLALDTGFTNVPLKIIIGDEDFTDTEDLNTAMLLQKISEYKGASSTACPSPDAWYNEFVEADFSVAITITGSLSGSYNSAMVAKDMVLEEYPDKKILIVNSLSTGPEMTLCAYKINELINEGNNFDDLCEKFAEYNKNSHLLFLLKSFDNLAKTGRVSKAVAKIAGVMHIQIVGKASDEGTLEILQKCRGTAKSYDAIIEGIKNSNYKNGKIAICHAQNENGAKILKQKLMDELGAKLVSILPASGLCCFYAEEGGLLVGYEA
ncbi:MAG: DegV family protein [Oscillospiraceae bacterium]